LPRLNPSLSLSSPCLARGEPARREANSPTISTTLPTAAITTSRREDRGQENELRGPTTPTTGTTTVDDHGGRRGSGGGGDSSGRGGGHGRDD
jgi:hypothetical protein